jgi:hypothetical protein
VLGWLRLPSLRDSISFRLENLGLTSQAIACRNFAAMTIVG